MRAITSKTVFGACAALGLGLNLVPAQQSVTADDLVRRQVTEEGITVTIEVEAAIKVMKGMPQSWLAALRQYPTLTIDVKPPEPKDFVVSINGTSYSPGASRFKVLEGKIAITVIRAGKDPCSANVTVVFNAPNWLACNL